MCLCKDLAIGELFNLAIWWCTKVDKILLIFSPITAVANVSSIVTE